jgi:hypothetical protein
MSNVVRIKRKPRPLRKTYSPAAPFVVNRQDQEDGSIQYEIWDERPDSYRRLCTVSEDYCDDSEDGDPDRGQSMKDADLIMRALNFMHGYKPC